MKLKEGSYENLITKGLQKDIHIAENNGMICKMDKIDEAESPSIIAQHIQRIINYRLADENMTQKKRIEFANKLIDFLTENDGEIIDYENILSAIISKDDDAILKATKKEIPRPLTGFRTSNLFTGGQSIVPMNVELERDIESADNIYIIVSFLRLSGLNLIYRSSPHPFA